MTHKEYLQKVGLEIKVARIRKSMSVQDVSKATGLHDGTINKVERGVKDTHILTYKRIADALQIEMKDFL